MRVRAEFAPRRRGATANPSTLPPGVIVRSSSRAVIPTARSWAQLERLPARSAAAPSSRSSSRATIVLDVNHDGENGLETFGLASFIERGRLSQRDP